MGPSTSTLYYQINGGFQIVGGVSDEIINEGVHRGMKIGVKRVNHCSYSTLSFPMKMVIFEKNDIFRQKFAIFEIFFKKK